MPSKNESGYREDYNFPKQTSSCSNKPLYTVSQVELESAGPTLLFEQFG
jgi:hypothetical protein